MENSKKKLDAAVAAHVYNLITLGGHEPEALLGTELNDLRIRFGNEGPDGWTSCNHVAIEQHHIDAALRLTAQ